MISVKNSVSLPYVDHKVIYHSLIAVGPFKSQNCWGEHDHGDKYLVILISDRIVVSIRAPFPMITFSTIWENDGLFCTNSASRLFLSAPSSAKGSLPKEHSDVHSLDNSRQVTIFKKWTTTLSVKQDMFRSFNDHLQL